MFRWTCRSSRRNTWTLSSQMWTDFNSPSSDQDLSQIRSDRDRSQIRSDQDLFQISSDQDLSQLSSVQDLSQISSDQDNLCNHSLIKRSLSQLTELWPKSACNWTNLISQPLRPWSRSLLYSWTEFNEDQRTEENWVNRIRSSEEDHPTRILVSGYLRAKNMKTISSFRLHYFCKMSKKELSHVSHICTLHSYSTWTKKFPVKMCGHRFCIIHQ